ncbi:MAG: Mitochondrial matrix cochaperone [Phylliscum demangeonii]|nr:MAG: Mitochondrial matrix cochaperone [Phylliscum demangeonii]
MIRRALQLPRTRTAASRAPSTTTTTTAARQYQTAATTSLLATRRAAPLARTGPLTTSPSLPWRMRIRPAFYSTATEPGGAGGAAGARAAASAPEAHEGPASEDAETIDVSASEDPMKQELEAKKREIIDLKDKYIRSVAEFRNLQDRTRREVQHARDFAIQRFAKDLIESIDNLDRALTVVPAERLAPIQEADGEGEGEGEGEHPAHAVTRDLINLHDGLKMTETILMQTLKKHGLERFDPSADGAGDQKFDPNRHEATFQTRVDGKEDGTVFHTQQKGFLLNGRVLRAAKVGIVKNS